MTNRRTAMPVVASICFVVAAGCGPAFPASSPTDFNAGDDEPGIVPSAIPMPALPAVDEQTATDATQGNPLWGLPTDSLRATRERPLFSPSRRPPPQAVVNVPVTPVQAVAPVTAAPTLSLLGIVAGKDEAFAVFVNTQTHDTVRLRTGEGEGGWVLRSVSGREAVIEKDHRTEILKLPPTVGVPK